MSRWRVHRVASTGSTNSDVAAAARAGEPEGYVLVADEQTAGRGRLGRPWSSPAGSSLSVSILLRPGPVAGSRWSWLPLLVGVAVVDAVHDAAGLPANLKWPNDVLLEGGKLAGILVERVDTPAGPAAVAGVGLNVTAAPDGAASLMGTGATRDGVLDALLARLDHWYLRWRSQPELPDLAAAYRAACQTLGRDVRAELPSGEAMTGRALTVDDAGRLVIGTVTGELAVGAGDIVHLRPTGG